MRFTLTTLFVLPFALAQRKGSGGGSGGGDDSLFPEVHVYTLTHTYTYSYLISTFSASPVCALTTAWASAETSTTVVITATGPGREMEAERLLDEMAKTRAFATPTRAAVETVGTVPSWVLNTRLPVSGDCTAIVTRSSAVAGSGAGSVAVQGAGTVGAVSIVAGLAVGLGMILL